MMRVSDCKRIITLPGRWLLAAYLCLCINAAMAAADPLPSWAEGASKSAVTEFVQQVTTAGSPDFVAADERIAVFDNDGTLWSEKPAYFQLLFAIDRIRELAPQHPEWKTTQPFKAVLDNDLDALADSGEKGLIQLVMASHAGMTTTEFEQIVLEWLKGASHA